MRDAWTRSILRAIAPLSLPPLLAGCPDGANPAGAIQTQVQARQEGQAIIDTTQAERAVQAYQAQVGENPPSLEALEAKTGKLPALPAGRRYVYDPATAKITVE